MSADTSYEPILGKRHKRTETDQMPYFKEFAKIHFLNNARKMAKKRSVEAENLYQECCSALGKEKATMISFFKAINSDDDLNSAKEWSVTLLKSLSAH